MSEINFSLTPKKVPRVNTKYRKIKTKIPTNDVVRYFTHLNKIESRSMHGQLPILWKKAEGFTVTDNFGNMWIDFTSTIFVANAGHGNKKIINALKRAINIPLIATYTYVHKERVEYLDYLIKKTPKNFEKAFLLSAGTEATEVAMKLMRLNAINQNKRKAGIICFDGNWHGRTTGAQLMSGNKDQKKWLGFDDPNIHHLRFPYPWLSDLGNPEKFFEDSIKKLLKQKKINAKKDLCGFMIETFQGWGSIFYPKPFIKAISKFAKENDMLITFDEMQSGFGRTGKLFGYMHYDIKPDLICCGKGASSSLPLAIVLGSSKILDLPDEGSMSSTHSANPLSCVAGHANLKIIIEDKLIENSKKLGTVMHNMLEKIKKKYPNHIKYIFGKGLIAGIIFYDNNNQPLSNLCSNICEKAMQKGLILVHTGRESIKVGPPLTIKKEALIEGINVLEESIKESINEFR